MIYLAAILASGQNAPPEVTTCLKTSVPRFLQNAFDNGYESQFGFKKSDKVADITITEPFKLYQFNTEKVKSYKDSENVKTLGEGYAEWFALVLLNDEAKAFVTIAH